MLGPVMMRNSFSPAEENNYCTISNHYTLIVFGFERALGQIQILSMKMTMMIIQKELTCGNADGCLNKRAHEIPNAIRTRDTVHVAFRSLGPSLKQLALNGLDEPDGLSGQLLAQVFVT